MLARINTIRTSKTWINGLTGVKKNPHRVVFMSESTDLDLLVTTQKAHKKLFSRKTIQSVNEHPTVPLSSMNKKMAK